MPICQVSSVSIKVVFLNKEPVFDTSYKCGKDSGAKENAAKCARPVEVDGVVPARSQHPFAVPGKFELQMLGAHNAYREHHSAPPLVRCLDLTQQAQAWANNLAKCNRMFHMNWELRKPAGENLAYMWSSCSTNFSGMQFTNLWYYEGLHYRWPGVQLENQKSGKGQTGHFTQLVWKNSKRVGFGRAISDTGRVYVVARYVPAGNYIDWYKVNVLPPKDGKLSPRYRP